MIVGKRSCFEHEPNRKKTKPQNSMLHCNFPIRELWFHASPPRLAKLTETQPDLHVPGQSVRTERARIALAITSFICPHYSRAETAGQNCHRSEDLIRGSYLAELFHGLGAVA